MMVCEDCGFVFNKAFNLNRMAYGEDYDNTQTCSSYFASYVDGLVQDLVNNKGVRNSAIVEVGCGKGHFLRKLVSYPDSGNTGVGFDPSYVGPDNDLNGALAFRRCYYDHSCADVPADVVVCRHVIEHIPDPSVLLRSVRAALVHSRKAKVYFETPCVDWILQNRVVWDFFYEHCSLFTANSLSLAFRNAGFAVERVDHIFGGQYLWLEARVSDDLQTFEHQPPHTAALARAYGADERELRNIWRQKLLDLKSLGKVALWGAGAKGATFANMVDPDGAIIDCVVDLNPAKQGNYIPGTGHPIVAPESLPHLGIANAVLMNPNYREENIALLNELRIALNLVELCS